MDFSAPVEAFHFEEGQRVEQGQLLIRLDSRKRALRLAQAVTAVAETRAGLEEARRDLARVTLDYEDWQVLSLTVGLTAG